MRTLLLTPWLFPHKVLAWEDAVTLVYRGKVDVLVEYGQEISSPSVTWKIPAVLRLRRPIGHMRRGVKFSRLNVFTRDKFRCQYCGEKFSYDELTYDHVIPARLGGEKDWENIVTACSPCNNRKGGRTCDQARMWPLTWPKKPESIPVTGPLIKKDGVPEEWQGFCDGLIHIV
jgi:5-methylcytosine-specific restriction endonuclease McrA